MADNLGITTGSDATVAADEIGGVHYQRVKVTGGSDGTASDIAATSNELHVRDATARTTLASILAALEGTIDVDDSDTQTALATLIAHVDGLEALLTTIDADTGNIATAVQLLDNAISGSEMQVDVVGALPAGTNNIGQVDPRGNIAHDTADTGNPIKVGGRARTALPAAVAQDDRVDAIRDKFGRELAIAAPLDQRVSGALNRTNNTAADVIAAPGSNIAIVVTDIIVVNGHATVSTKVSVRSATTVKLTEYCAADGGGFTLSNPDGLFVAGTNEAITAICGTTGADVDVFVSGYKIPA